MEYVEYVKSTRGNACKILHNEYSYVKQKDLANGVVSYECVFRKKSKDIGGWCNARIKVYQDCIIGFVNEHSHEPGVKPLHGPTSYTRAPKLVKPFSKDLILYSLV